MDGYKVRIMPNKMKLVIFLQVTNSSDIMDEIMPYS